MNPMDPLGDNLSGELPTRWSYGLISTKLNAPPLKSRMVERIHLLDRLSEGRDARLIVISGVAGSGKTSLACRWILRDRLRAAWYSLDEADNDSDLFFRYLFAALHTIDDRLASTYGRWLRDGRRFTRREVICYLIECLLALPTEVYLVLDDYHFILSREIHDIVVCLLDHMPPRLHVVVTTRYSLPFSVPHFKVRNQVVEISASDMKFTERETEKFFEETIPVAFTADGIHAVSRLTEGWVGGLQLFGLSLKNKEAAYDLSAALSGLRSDATNYLVDEVISVQPKKVRDFLETTALLDRFNVELCREITGMPDCADVLDYVCRNNLFLVPLDGERTWYRYHHLFSEALKDRAKASSPDRLRKVYCQAALWFARGGYLEDAFRNAFASGDIEFAADLMEEHLLFVNDRYEYASGRRWLASLPHEMLMERTLLRLYDCGHGIESFHFSEIEAVINDIEADQNRAFDRYNGHKRALCEDLFIYFKHVLRYFYRDPVHADIERLNKAFEMISPENKLFSGHIKILIGLSYILQGDLFSAENALNEALPLIMASGTSFGRVFWYRSMANVERIRGRLHRSEAILEEAFDFLRLKGLSGTPLRFLLYLSVAWVCYHRNDMEKALEYAKGAASYGEQVKFARDAIEGNVLLSLIYFAKGNREETESRVREAERLSNEFGAADRNGSPDPRIQGLLLRLGGIFYAAQSIDQHRLTRDQPFSIYFFRDCLFKADLLCHRGSPRVAVKLLEQLRERCVERRMMEAVLEIDLYRCAVHRLLEEDEKARYILEKALSFADPEWYVRPFVDHAAAVLPILNDLVRKHSERRLSAHFREVLCACRLDGNRGSAAKRAGRRHGSELTDRETEVLKLMAAGYRYKEIALQISVSLETVRTHSRHILEKLNADSRGQAVRRAKGLLLL